MLLEVVVESKVEVVEVVVEWVLMMNQGRIEVRQAVRPLLRQMGVPR